MRAIKVDYYLLYNKRIENRGIDILTLKYLTSRIIDAFIGFLITPH